MGFSRSNFVRLFVLFGTGAGCQSLPINEASPRWALEKSLVFYPKRFPEGDWDKKRDNFEDVSIETPDGIRLHGWFAEAENPRTVILYAHGNGGNVSHRIEPIRLLNERLGASVLVFDYRGYGKSEGQPTEAGVLTDARAARRWLAQRTGVAEGDIVLLGNSLGGGVAVDLAARDGARGLILENTFTSLPDVAKWYTRGFPLRWIMTCRLDSLARIHDYHGPLLQTHGDADKVVPFKFGKKLFEAANEPKQFVHVAGGDHYSPPSPEYYQALDQFLDQLKITSHTIKTGETIQRDPGPQAPR